MTDEMIVHSSAGQAPGSGWLARAAVMFHKHLTKWVAVAWSVFQLYTSAYSPLPALSQRSIHIAFATLLIFLVLPPRKGMVRMERRNFGFLVLDTILALAGVWAVTYVTTNWEYMSYHPGVFVFKDYLASGIGLLIILEITRRAGGLAISILGVLSILYAMFGRSMPGMTAHPGFSLAYLSNFLFFTTEGIWGMAAGVSATLLFIFVLYGEFLTGSGAIDLFKEFSIGAFGRYRAGPAKISVVSSALVGTVSGSAMANVYITGQFTIPLMKSVGYKAEFAGAVEAVASPKTTTRLLSPARMSSALPTLWCTASLPMGTGPARRPSWSRPRRPRARSVNYFRPPPSV